MSYGFTSNMRDALPNASSIGVIGMPIEQNEANTRSVVGAYVSVYDIQQADSRNCLLSKSPSHDHTPNHTPTRRLVPAARAAGGVAGW